MALFTASELSTYLGYDVSGEAADIAERVAAGWLTAAGVDTTVFPIPHEVFSWAVELAAIAHENPGGLSESSTGDRWNLARRGEILAAAAEHAATVAGRVTGLQPRGSFPDPSPWPDPVYP